MSRINELHSQAMDLAALADRARRHGEEADAADLFRHALNLEREAAYLVPRGVEPSRSVFFRSAASLAMECGDYVSAERLIGEGLAGDGPEEIRDELRDLFETVTFHRHLELREVVLEENEVQFSLAGSAVAFGMIPASEYVPRLHAVDKLFERTSERLQHVPFRERGRQPKAIRDLFTSYVSLPRGRSFAVTIRVSGRHGQGLLFGSPNEVVNEFLICMRLFSEDRLDALGERFEDAGYKRNFLSLAHSLAPDGERIQTVGFTGIDSSGKKPIDVALRPKYRESPVRRINKDPQVLKVRGELWLAEKMKRNKNNVIGIKQESGEILTVAVAEGLGDILQKYWDVPIVAYIRQEGRSMTLENIVPDVDKANASL